MSEKIPEKWTLTELSKIVIYSKGKKPKKLVNGKTDGYVPYVNIKAFEQKIIDEYADVESSKLVDESDILVVWDGARFGLSGTAMVGAAGSTLMVLKPILCYSRFVHAFINRYYQYINSKPKGSGTPHVNPDIFWNLPFPLPPLNEQKRIVAKLDAIIPRIDSVKERLEKIPVILKRFRQSVLTAAVTGKLTEKWREEHPEAGEWLKSELKELIDFTGNGISKRKGFKGDEITVLRLADFINGIRVFGKERKIMLEKKEQKKYIIDKGDILVVRVNGSKSITGLFILYEGENEAFCDHFIRLKIKPNALPKYITYVANFGIGRRFLENKMVTSAGQNTISQSSIFKLSVPLPPLEEQKEIVRQVDKLFALADKVEAHYQQAKERVDKLSQSVLAKAFRGELVNQDPTDEPAEKLLEQILEEKAKMEATLKKAKKKSTTKKTKKKGKQ